MAVKFVVLATFVVVFSVGVFSAPIGTSHTTITQHHTESYHGSAAPALHYDTSEVYDAPVAQYAAPVHKDVGEEDYFAPAHYGFEYSVHDPHTGDVKQQKESRQGDVVHGSYSFIEADGSKRIVEYTVDKHSGFNAVVHREPAENPVPHMIVAPVAIHAAPDHSYYHH